MKKVVLFLLILVGLISVSSCGNTETPTPTVAATYNIEFENNGLGEKPNALKDVNEVSSLPVLSEEGYNFIGWYTDKELTKEFVSGTTLTGNVTLYAKWEKVTYDYTKYDNNTKLLLTAGGFLDGKITDFNHFKSPDNIVL